MKLEQKIRLLSLMEVCSAASSTQHVHCIIGPQLVFRRHAHQRTIDFTTIAETAQVDITEVFLQSFSLISLISLGAQVEMLVMKALSLGLVKGTASQCWCYCQCVL